MKIKPLDTENLIYLISNRMNLNNYKVGIVCDSVADFLEIIKAIDKTNPWDDNWRGSTQGVINLNTGSSIEYIHNGNDTARAYRYHEIFYYNCEIYERFKEYVLLPILRPIEEL